jgi:hypothetical protein
VSAFPRAGIERTILYFLSKAKVNQLKVAFGVYEYVLGLEISICDSFSLVEEL